MFDIRLFDDVGLRIYLNDDKIERIEFVKSASSNAPSHLVEKFSPYIRGEGDPALKMEDLDLEGYTENILRVYHALREVCTFGKVVTYSLLAEITGTHPRFVGYCMKVNRFPIVIPCHRVVGKRGLGGFSFGEDLKRKLLSFEGINL